MNRHFIFDKHLCNIPIHFKEDITQLSWNTIIEQLKSLNESYPYEKGDSEEGSRLAA